jgi:hypothetical protein
MYEIIFERGSAVPKGLRNTALEHLKVSERHELFPKFLLLNLFQFEGYCHKTSYINVFVYIIQATSPHKDNIDVRLHV